MTAAEGRPTGGLHGRVRTTSKAWSERVPTITLAGQNWDWLEGVHGRTFRTARAAQCQAQLHLHHQAGIAGGKDGSE